MIEISYEEILAIHNAALTEHGGTPGVRDEGLILSAISQPNAGFGDEDLYKTLPEKVAALGFSLSKNHGFVDGNKRVAFIAMSVFSLRSGYRLDITEPEIVSFITALAAGQKNRDDLAEWIGNHLTPLAPHSVDEMMDAEDVIYDYLQRKTISIQNFNVAWAAGNEKLHKINARTAVPLGVQKQQLAITKREMAEQVEQLAANFSDGLDECWAAVNIVGASAPYIMEWTKVATRSEESEAWRLLINLGQLLDGSSELVDNLRDVDEVVAGIGTLSPRLERACTQFVVTVNKMGTMFNEHWFSHKDMVEELKKVLVR